MDLYMDLSYSIETTTIPKKDKVFWTLQLTMKTCVWGVRQLHGQWQGRPWTTGRLAPWIYRWRGKWWWRWKDNDDDDHDQRCHPPCPASPLLLPLQRGQTFQFFGQPGGRWEYRQLFMSQTLHHRCHRHCHSHHFLPLPSPAPPQPLQSPSSWRPPGQ